MDDELRFPIGKFVAPQALDETERATLIAQLAETPARLREAVAGLDERRLETPYRPDGWTVRQVVHHLPDSHMNGYVRFRLALTEEQPMAKVYDEARWAELADGRSAPIGASLDLVSALHLRWVAL